MLLPTTTIWLKLEVKLKKSLTTTTTAIEDDRINKG